MTTTSSPARSHYHHMGEPISSPGVIDFFTERDRLLAEIDEFNRRHKIKEEIRQAAARRSQGLSDRLETWLYSMLSAAALVCLLWGILGLADFAAPRAQRTGAAVRQSQTTDAPRGQLGEVPLP
ncbi:MAG: hypothetical protein WB586_30355 [Chthoniobacterales bacterium]